MIKYYLKITKVTTDENVTNTEELGLDEIPETVLNGIIVQAEEEKKRRHNLIKIFEDLLRF